VLGEQLTVPHTNGTLSLRSVRDDERGAVLVDLMAAAMEAFFPSGHGALLTTSRATLRSATLAPSFGAEGGGMEPVVRVRVTVTFLRMDRPPAEAAPALPTACQVVRLESPTVGFYRYLYNTVGADYVWWLRRTMPDDELAMLLRDPMVSIYVLYAGGEPAGFFELDGRVWTDMNLSYFGLMPHAIGTGLGYAFLRQAVDTVWRSGARGMTVNTCTADHPRALPTYLRAGFRTLRQMRELWNVPQRLGLNISEHLKA
jgi:GNAT superfamily N-acetyltransferase